MNGRVVLEVPARPEFLLLARLAVTSVGRSAGASEETIADLKLAVTEAVANAVKHAYPAERPGRVTVELTATAGRLEIAVSDEGRGLGDADVSIEPRTPGRERDGPLDHPRDRRRGRCRRQARRTRHARSLRLPSC